MHSEFPMTPIAPIASIPSQPPALNHLQVLWLKELGIEQLWGNNLQAQDQLTSYGEQAKSVILSASQAASPAQTVSDGRLGPVQSETSMIPPQASLTQSNVSIQQVTQSSLGSSPSSGAATGGDKPAKQAHKNNPLSRLLEDMSDQQKQSKSRRLQRKEAIRQADRPQVEGLDWAQLAAQVQSCQACPLHEERTRAVFGELGTQASLMIIDEMPGKEDDLSGHLFDSRSGLLLDKMLAAIGLDRNDVVLSSLLKCRSADGAPSELSLMQCQHYLLAQIQLAQPRCILVLGRAAFSFLQQTPGPFEHLREQEWHYTTAQGQEIPVVVSYHPGYLMIHQEDKALAWQDLKRVAKILAA